MQKEFEALKAAQKEREEMRLKYDHYRTKMGRIGSKKNDKIERNKQKLEESKVIYETSHAKLEDVISKIDAEQEVVTKSMTILFSKEVEVKFYQKMSQQFSMLMNIEDEMRRLAME